MWFNNVHGHGAYGFRSNNSNENQTGNIVEFLPPGSPSSWNRNLIINPAPYAVYPGTAVTLSGNFAALFVDYAKGDFSLAKISPNNRKGLDGQDLGVDMSVLKRETFGCIVGNWNQSETAAPAVTRPRTVKPSVP